ncbi:MAG TPA: transporter substrate-binding domain-containing protein [Candidatus Hydrogenedentes bacterium]|nr:transporter substrate-binding domain-containing protein [Candidatus Hydrogenedentota bacterium]
MHRILSIALAFLSTAAIAEELVVDTKVIPPMVMKENDKFTGFSVDLWHDIAKKMDVEYVWREAPLAQMFTDLQENKADVAIAAISITAKREELVDFSQPMLRSGLRIAVHNESSSGFASTFKILSQGTLLKTLLYFLLFIVVCGHVLWYVERGREAINDSYFPGIFEAFWCVLATMTTVGYGDIAPKKWLGRFAAMLVMLTGISFFGFVLAQVTAGLTEQQLFNIKDHHDLRGKKVATVAGTTSEKTLRELGADIVSTQSIEAMQDKLLAQRVDAIVYDSPSILYFADREHESVSAVGNIFAEQYYGIAVQEDSPLLEPINRALLALRDDGTYDTLYAKWFGTR